jgi:hypothetical protein
MMDMKKPETLTIREESLAGSKILLNILKSNLPYARLAKTRFTDFNGSAELHFASPAMSSYQASK